MLSAVAFVGLAAVYWRGGQPQAEGALLAVGFAGLAYGLVTWGNHLLPQGPFEEARHQFGDEAQESLFEDDMRRGEALTRRKLLVRTLVLAAGGLGVAAVFPIRSLGPKPGRKLLETPCLRSPDRRRPAPRPRGADRRPGHGVPRGARRLGRRAGGPDARRARVDRPRSGSGILDP